MIDLDRRRTLQFSLLAASMAAIPFKKVSASKSLADTSGVALSDPSHDFDLFFGTWHAEHRRLKQRLVDNKEWITFDGTQTRAPLLGGQANIDDNVFNVPGGAYRGITLQSYTPKTKTWAVWWLDGRDPGTMNAPFIGSFRNGVGTFLVDDTFDGKPIKVRFIWSEITANSHRWEQAFSADGGKTWETNWITQYSKTG